MASRQTELARRVPPGTEIELSEARDERFVTLTSGHSVRAIQDHLCARLGLNPQVLLEVPGMDAAKLIAAEKGFDNLMKSIVKPAPVEGKKAAIIGGGPTGMAAAYFLGSAIRCAVTASSGISTSAIRAEPGLPRPCATSTNWPAAAAAPIR